MVWFRSNKNVITTSLNGSSFAHLFLYLNKCWRIEWKESPLCFTLYTCSSSGKTLEECVAVVCLLLLSVSLFCSPLPVFKQILNNRIEAIPSSLYALHFLKVRKNTGRMCCCCLFITTFSKSFVYTVTKWFIQLLITEQKYNQK